MDNQEKVVPATQDKRLWQVNPAFAVCLVLVLTLWIGYQQVRDFDFIVLDDPAYVMDNHRVNRGLTRSGLFWAVTGTHSANWHPLTWVSHMLDCSLFGLNPGAHHLVNVFLHLINSLLLFRLIRGTTGEAWPAGVVAILFAVHPVQVESVAWVAQRKTLLCALFMLVTLLAYHRYAETGKTAAYLAVLLFFALGLTAKPAIVTLPVIMLLLDYWPLNRLPDGSSRQRLGFRAWSPLIIEKAPLLVMASASAMVTLYAQQQGGAVATVDALAIGVRISNAVVSYAGYMKKMVWPEPLAVLYPHPLSIPVARVVLAAILLGGITLFVFLMRKRHPYLLVGWFWYLGSLVPVIGIIQVGVQGMADRYLYIPMIGLCLMLVWGARACVARRRIGWKSVALLAAGIASVYLSITCRQVGYWQDSITLFRHTLAVTRDNYLAHHSLGLALFQKGKTAEAIDQYRKSIAIHPEYDAPQVDLGTAFFSQGRLDAAAHHFSEAIRINPKNAAALNNKGAVLSLQGRADDAIRHYRDALSSNPVYADAHRNLAGVLLAKGDCPAAVYHYRKIIQLDAANKYDHNNLGIALAALGRADAAASHFSKALTLDRNFSEADHNLRILSSGSSLETPDRLKMAGSK